MLYLLLKNHLNLSYAIALIYFHSMEAVVYFISIFALSQLIVILWQVVDSFTIIRLLQHSGIAFKRSNYSKRHL